MQRLVDLAPASRPPYVLSRLVDLDEREEAVAEGPLATGVELRRREHSLRRPRDRAAQPADLAILG